MPQRALSRKTIVCYINVKLPMKSMEKLNLKIHKKLFSAFMLDEDETLQINVFCYIQIS